MSPGSSDRNSAGDNDAAPNSKRDGYRQALEVARSNGRRFDEARYHRHRQRGNEVHQYRATDHPGRASYLEKQAVEWSRSSPSSRRDAAPASIRSPTIPPGRPQHAATRSVRRVAPPAPSRARPVSGRRPASRGRRIDQIPKDAIDGGGIQVRAYRTAAHGERQCQPSIVSTRGNCRDNGEWAALLQAPVTRRPQSPR